MMIRPLHLEPESIGIGMTSQRARDRFVQRLRLAGIENESVLATLRTLPRHLFLDEALAQRAYEDTALPIGHSQTISQPWVVARMTELLLRTKPKKVLEVGTGSGYQAAVLAALGCDVFTIERIGELLRAARKRFRKLNLDVRSKHDDGSLGWIEHAPFDAIVVTAAAPSLPSALFEQLVPGGCLVAPVGDANTQSLIVTTRTADGTFEQEICAQVTFVPLLGGVVS